MSGFAHSYDFTGMYEEYFSKVYNYVFYRILNKEQTEDIVSDVFLKVAQNISRYDPQKARFNTWIFAIVRNTLTDYFRLRKTGISIDDEGSNVNLSVDFEKQCDLIKDETLKELYKALAQIDDRTRNIIVMKHFEELTNREISKRLCINESTVSTVYVRGLKKLRELMAV